MEVFYCHPKPHLAGFDNCTNFEVAAAMASNECSTISPPLSIVTEQLQESFPPSFGSEAGGVCGGAKGRRVVSIERSSTTTSLGSAQERDGSGSSSRKNKKSSNASVASVKVEEEPAAGYIHVKARRGQATDSHSVAERLRREKINEKMKMLQSLIPGCDKLAGKALLDEIISYVQSLQSQVEFLSMKLATLNPMMVYELGLHIGGTCHPDAQQMIRTAEMPPHQEWMGQATAAAEAQGGVPTGATGIAQDGDGGSGCVNVMQMQMHFQGQQEEDDLNSCMRMSCFRLQ